MKVGFLKRLGAFVFDYLIVGFILSFIMLGFKPNSDIYKRTNELIKNYMDGKISVEEYTKEYKQINYDMQKEDVLVNGISAGLYVGYFVIFAWLNKGKTIGKKLFKIKVVGKDNRDVTLVNMLVRSLFIYGILSSIYSAIFVNFLGVNAFDQVGTIVSWIEGFVIIVSFFMVTYRKDKRGLHDIMAGTSVIGEVR